MSKFRTVISQEMLTVSNKRLLGAELLAVVEKMQANIADCGVPDPQHVVKLSEIIERRTGMDITVIYNDFPMINAAARVWQFRGHNGLAYEGEWTQPINVVDDRINYQMFDLDLDLDTGMVTGSMVKRFPMQITLFGGLFDPKHAFTAGEVNAVLLHEIGHCYGMFAALGDYVWLNYMLTEGVEVVLGRKANRYKLQVCNMTYIKSVVTDTKLKEELTKAPTEEAVRRAVLTAWRMMPRHHMTSDHFEQSIKRDEQFADWYASRQGFGRDAVTFEAKSDKILGTGGSHTRKGASFFWAESAKLMLGVTAILTLPILPISLLCAATLASLANPEHERYDNPTERIHKVRRDLISQLKDASGDASFKATLVDDIRMVDDILKDYNTNRTAWEVIGQALFKSNRKQYQLKKHDETLEGLLNNDAFLMAQRFTTLK